MGMELAELMGIRPGITAVIGGGGKTTFLRKAGEELSEKNRVLLCTTTRIFPFPGIPLGSSRQELAELRQGHRLICGGQWMPETGKLGPLDIPMEELAAQFDYVLVEADGSAGRPMKAHAPHEPVIPRETNQVISMIGASGFGKTIGEAAHRPELYAQVAHACVENAITPELAASVLRAEHLEHRVFVNQVEAVEQLDWVRRFAAVLDCPVAAGALQRGAYFKCE